jgi:iron complex transport system substrate-binding protein
MKGIKMKQRLTQLTLLLLVTILIFTGCTPANQTTPTDAIEAPETTLPEEELTEEATGPAGRFTIQADADLQPAVTVLYAACFPDELPVFVDAEADLLVTTATQDDAFSLSYLPATFLPGTVLIPQSDSFDAAYFIAFAVSPAGQQVLIDIGALPPTVTLTDQAGNTVEIDQPVRRVISTYGPATAIVYSVDAESRLASASYLGARDELGAAAMERIDPRFQDLIGDDNFSQDDFNLEEAANLDPDLIITSARTSWLDTVSELGVPFFLYDAETPERLKEAVLLTGQLFGPNSTAQAEAWVNYYDWVYASILEQTQDLPEEERPRVLFTGTAPTRVASGDMYQTSLIEIAGGISASAELTGYWNDVNLEQIAAWDPDVIIVPPYGGATVGAITENPDWQILDAVQAGRVFQMPKLVVPWDTPSPDSVLGIIWLAQRLFPDVVTLDCAEQAQYFYYTYYDYPISADEIDTICAVD